MAAHMLDLKQKNIKKIKKNKNNKKIKILKHNKLY